jgi:hypothetical protein
MDIMVGLFSSHALRAEEKGYVRPYFVTFPAPSLPKVVYTILDALALPASLFSLLLSPPP